MSGNTDQDFWAKANAHLVRYGGAFSPVIAESAAGNWFVDGSMFFGNDRLPLVRAALEAA